MELPGWTQRPAARWALLVLAAVVGIHLVAAVALLGLQRAHADEVLPNVAVAGEPVGGLSRPQLEDAVAERADERLAQPVHLVARDAEMETDRAGVGGRIDTDASVEAAWDQGRRGLWRALYEQLAARLGAGVEVDLRLDLDDEALDRAATAAAESLSREPRPAEVRFEVVEEPDDVDVEVVEPEAGLEVPAEDLADRIAERFHEQGAIEIEVPVEATPPEVTQEDVDAVLPDARLAVSEPVTLANPSDGADVELTPADLARVLVVAADPDADEGQRLEVTSDADRLRDHLGEEGIDAVQTAAVEASFEVVGGEVEIHGGTPGFELDAPTTADRIVELALEEPPREDELPGEVTQPELTREDAEALGVQERVSSFTTPLVPGQPRNHNIHLGADYLDGSLIRPGERFSLNEAIGPRTSARGFQENGFIDAEGELVSVVGGGSSQLGTTFLNAAWFAGIELVDFKPHSYYFERYPMGREATLSYNTIDVVVVNDSPHGILVSTSYTESSVTISFFSTSWAEVETWTGDPYNEVEGDERDGFDIDFGRTIHYPDGTSESESYFHRYQPED